MPLTNADAKNATKRDRPYKLADSGGLYLYVSKSGSKSWRMKFEFRGKEQLLTFGPYPDISLSAARAKRDEARAQLRDQVNPAGARRRAIEAEQAAALARAQQVNFEKLARQWHELQAPRWAPVHAADVINSLERDIFPHLGDTPIAEVDTPTVLAVLRKVEARGSIETAKRLRQRIHAIFAFAKGEGLVRDNPATDVGESLKPKPKARKQPSITDPEQAREVLRAAEASGAHPITKLASRLLALTAVRPAIVRGVTWGEFEGIDWEDRVQGPTLALWRVPAARMKLLLDRKDEETFDHLVPLSWQAVEVLRAVHRLTGRNKLVFPGQRHSHRPLSENAIGYLYNRVGFHGRHVPHGWRASFSTTFNGRAIRLDRPHDVAIVELILAHEPENKVKAAYDRAGHLEARRKMLQEWADMLTPGLMPAGALLELPRR